jgi:hydroxymethylpyrimidine/phosphomethylpyrimidine kinase
VSKHGLPLLPPDAADALRAELLAVAALVTPNIPEAEALTGNPIRSLNDMRRAAEDIYRLGARAVLVKGGHHEGAAIDILFTGDGFHEFPAERVDTKHTHGTGCTFSAAIAAGLAGGASLVNAVGRAKEFIDLAIRTNPGLGKGCGPVNHHARV